METAQVLLNGLAYLPLLGFSALAFAARYPVLFAGLAGVAMITGLYTPRLLQNYDIGVAAGLGIVLYALFCVGMTYKYMLGGRG